MFYLEKPSLERKDDIIEYLEEFKKYKSQFNGTGSLDRIYEGYTFEEVLDRCLKMKDEEYARSVNRCPGETFLLIREEDNKLIGTINLRWNLTGIMKEIHGHIGYGVRPTERRKGYNKIQLYLCLLEAKKRGLDQVQLSCDIDNLGSNGTIKALGGVLDRCITDPDDNEPINIYLIDVNKSLEEYKDVYEPYISKTNTKK